MLNIEAKSASALNQKISLLIIFLVSISWLSVTFFGFQPVDQFDWDQVFAYHELQRKIILDFQQLPLWNPYICGGEPWLAHPESDFLSFNSLFILAFGTFHGIIFIHFLQVFIGMAGMYYLSGHFMLSRKLSLANSIFFLAVYNLLTFIGNFASLNISLVPWIYLFFNRIDKNKNNLICVSILLALLVLSGAYYVFMIAFMIIALDVIYRFARKRNFDSLKNLIYISFFSIILSSLKFFPMIDLIKKYPRYVAIPSAGFFNLARLFSITWITRLIDMLGWALGVMLFILLIAATILLWKKYRVIVITSLVFLLLFLGNDSPVNLWQFFHFFIPSLKEHRIFLMPLFIMMSLSLGLVIKELQMRIRGFRNLKFAAYIILCSVIIFNIFFTARRIFAQSEIIHYRIDNPGRNFIQTRGNFKRMYESIVNNQGVVYGYDSIGNQIETKVMPRELPEYEGEYFLVKDSGKVRNFVFSPNRLEFKLDLVGDDILVINQNYFPGWRSSRGRVFNYNGLIGVHLKPEDKELNVYYLPFSFIAGLVTFTCGVFSIIIYSRLKKNSRACLIV